MKNREQTTPLQILCEGRDDLEFLSRFVSARGLTDYHCMCPTGEDGRCLGKGGFKQHLELIAAGVPTGVPLKGIIIASDCDDDPEASFRDVQRSVRQAGFPNTDRAQTIRTNHSGPAPTYAIMMLPWTGTEGNLELLIWKAIKPQLSQHLPGIEDFAQRVGADSRTLSLRSKFNLRCLIAASIATDPSLGIVYFLQKPYAICPIDYFNPLFTQIYDFLKHFADTVMDRPQTGTMARSA